MPGIFEIEAKDILSLDSNQLTKLLLKLISLEAEKNDIPRSCIEGSLNITVSDDGEDAHINWNGNPQSTEWFPNKNILFQCKATNTGRANCKKEFLTNNGEIKKRVDEVLSQGGSYILFCHTDCTGKMIKERIKGFREALTLAQKTYSKSADIQIYDANKISNWVNDYISAITLVLEYVNRSMIRGLSTWDHKEGFSDFKMKYVADDILNGHLKQLRDHFTGVRKVARLVGLSGLGKTRLAFEMCRPPASSDVLSQQALSAESVFIDAKYNQDLPSLLNDWVVQGLSGTIIVDNCDSKLHYDLVKHVTHLDSKLNLLTLDYSSADEQRDGSPFIELKQMSDFVIRGIINEAYPSLSRSDQDRIVEFAQGFPQMAVLIAEARINDEPDIGRLKNQDLIDKLIWGRDSPDQNAKKVISACSLFKHLGFEKDLVIQRNFVAQNIVRMDTEDFYNYSVQFINRKIIDKRNRFIRVIPLPLAITLAAEWWKYCSPERAEEIFFSEMPDGMIESLCDQLRMLDFITQAKEIVSNLCDDNSPFGQAEVILSEKGSRLFRSLVEVNPDACVNTLERIFTSFTREELLEVGPARRNLVWSLEKLCFWKETFIEAARIMLSFASAENETWGNNATNQFLQLFHIYLSGTEATPDDRLIIIDEAIESDEKEKRVLGVKALGSIINTTHYVRMGGVEKQGSRAPSQDWRPKKYEEIFSYLEEAIKRLTNIACNDSDLSVFARDELAKGIRILVNYGRINALDQAILLITEKTDSFWPEAINNIKDTIKYDSEKISDEATEQMKNWLEILKPDTFERKLKFYVSIPEWEHVKDSNGRYMDISAVNAAELAKDISDGDFSENFLNYVQNILEGEQRQGFNFGNSLAKFYKKPRLLVSRILEILEKLPRKSANPSVLCGFLAGYDDRTYVTEILENVYNNEILCHYLVELTRLSKCNKDDLKRILKSIHEDKISIDQIYSFSYNSVLDHLQSNDVMWFCDEISAISIEGSACALNILYMYCLNSNDRWTQCKLSFRRYLMISGLIQEISQNNIFDESSWDMTARKLLKSDEHDSELAVAIVEDVVRSCKMSRFNINSQHYVSNTLDIIVHNYFAETWSILGDVLISKNWIEAFNLGQLFDRLHKDRKDNILYNAPIEMLVDWCNKNKPNGAKMIAGLMPLFVKKQDNSYTWHELARSMIDHFGSDESFLKAISENFGNFMWVNSLIPYYEIQIELMNELKNHKFKEVKKWSRGYIKWLNKMIEKERKREEEESIGIF